MVSKEALRIASMKRRTALSPGEQTLASLKICQRVYDEIDWSSVKRLNAYKALKSLHEVDPSSLLVRIGLEHPDIDIVVSKFKIDAAQPDGEFDIILVPLVAFDGSCNRIGMGGGWYDEYLASQPGALKVGIAFSLQKVAQVPISPVDVAMDMVITEKKTFKR